MLHGLDFATVKAICSGIGIVLFMTIFIVTALWVYRPGAKKYYQNIAQKILKE